MSTSDLKTYGNGILGPDSKSKFSVSELNQNSKIKTQDSPFNEDCKWL